MKYYLDNFRGFQNQTVDVMNATFFVGENSTGKSSLLKAIAIISDSRFWSKGELSTDSFELGAFEDILSVNHSRAFFSLGYIDEIKKCSQIYCFGNDKGLPMVIKQIFVSESILLVVDRIRNVYSYRQTDPFNFQSIKQILDSLELKENNEGWTEEKIGFFFEDLFLSILFDVRKNNTLTKFLNHFYSFCYPSMYIAPIRAKPQAIYAGMKTTYNAEGTHTPMLLKKAIKEKDRGIAALRRFGRRSGLFDDVETPNFGNKELAPFELVVRKGCNRYQIASVGYGVSQILPIIIDLIFSEGGLVLIQQPEVHLHPKAQSAFGEFLFTICKNSKNCKYIIETHSDYIIDSFRYSQKKSTKKVESKIVFFKNNRLHHNCINDIPIDSDGGYKEADVSDYRSFFIDESIKVMEI